MSLKPVIISAPFGNYWKLLRFADATHTLGTFTANARSWNAAPWGSRWLRVLLTLRYSLINRAWVNKIGLKNPGIDWCVKHRKKLNLSDKIISIHGFNTDEWNYLVDVCDYLKPLAIEMNVSCPNVNHSGVESSVFERAKKTNIPTIVKISPIFYQDVVAQAYAAGIRYFHACNTLPTPRGGMSGKPLLIIAQGVVKWLRTKYPDTTIIGGGGITKKSDVLEYRKNGANHVSVGTMLFNPLRWHKIKTFSSS